MPRTAPSNVTTRCSLSTGRRPCSTDHSAVHAARAAAQSAARAAAPSSRRAAVRTALRTLSEQARAVARSPRVPCACWPQRHTLTLARGRALPACWLSLRSPCSQDIVRTRCMMWDTVRPRLSASAERFGQVQEHALVPPRRHEGDLARADGGGKDVRAGQCVTTAWLYGS